MIAEASDIQYARDIQSVVGEFLFDRNKRQTTNIEEWKEVQLFLSKSISQLVKQAGKTPEEEGEMVLAILMGYTIAIRNSRHIDLALERAERVLPLIVNPELKCKLMIFCYGECLDEELAEMAHRILDRQKESGNTAHIEYLEDLLLNFEENAC